LAEETKIRPSKPHPAAGVTPLSDTLCQTDTGHLSANTQGIDLIIFDIPRLIKVGIRLAFIHVQWHLPIKSKPSCQPLHWSPW